MSEEELGAPRPLPLWARALAAAALFALPLVFGDRHALRTAAALFARRAIVAAGAGADGLFGVGGPDTLLALVLVCSGLSTLGAVVLVLRSPRQPRLGYALFAGGWIVSTVLACFAAVQSESAVRGELLAAVQESLVIRALLVSEVRVHADVTFGLGATLVLGLASARVLRAPPRTAAGIGLVAAALAVAVAVRVTGRPLSRCHLLGLAPIALAAAGALRNTSARDRALGVGALLGATLALDHGAHLAAVARALRLLYDATPANAVIGAPELAPLASIERASARLLAGDAVALLLAASAHGLAARSIGRAVATAAWPLTVCLAFDSALMAMSSSVAGSYARYEAFAVPAHDQERDHPPHPRAPFARVDEGGRVSWAESSEPFEARARSYVDLIADPRASVSSVLKVADGLAREGARRSGANKENVHFAWIARPAAEVDAPRSLAFGGLVGTRRAAIPVELTAVVDAATAAALERSSGATEWVVVSVDPSGATAQLSRRAQTRRVSAAELDGSALDAVGAPTSGVILAVVARADDTTSDVLPWVVALSRAAHARAGTTGRDVTRAVVVTQDRAGVARHVLGRPPPKAPAAAAAAAARPSAGCGRSEHLPAFSRRAVKVGEAERAYDLVVPTSGAPPRALVVAFHGGGGDPDEMRRELDLERHMPDAIVAYPAGRRGVWDLDTPAKDNADLAFFDKLLEFVTKAECVDESRVFLTGYSMGGYFATQLSCRRSTKVRAIVTHAAGGPALPRDERDEDGHPDCPGKVAALVLHGEKDDNVVPREGRGTLQHFRVRSGCSRATTPAPPSPCVAMDGCAREAPVGACTVPDLGHWIWPDEGGRATAAFFSRLSP